MAVPSCTEITDELIPFGGTLVFDWDNTLKLYDPNTREISSRVEKHTLHRWREEKKCRMYIISAINPSRINLETLLIEVEKLDLKEIFTQDKDLAEVKRGVFARKGNIIICGYDKAETFLEVVNKPGKSSDLSVASDEMDGLRFSDFTDMLDSKLNNAETARSKKFGSNSSKGGGDVVFFDDEEVNIINFRQIVKNSKCYLIK